MEKKEFDFLYKPLIEQAEERIGCKIKNMTILHQESKENKTHLLVTLENGRHMNITLHVFETPEKQMAARFYGNYVD